MPFWTGWARRGVAAGAVVLIGYVTVAGLGFAALWYEPQITVPILLSLSILHFGLGDVMTRTTRRASPVIEHRSGTGPVQAVVRVVALGGPVIAGPLLFWPGSVRAAFGAISLDVPTPTATVALALSVVVAAAIVGSVAISLRAGRALEAVEPLALAALFVVVPPLAAFGIFFGTWHGLRHTARLIVHDPRNAADLARGEVVRPLRRFVTSAGAPTIMALGLVIVLVAIAGRQDELVGPLFLVLLALTTPHLVIVAALDLADLRAPGGWARS